MKRAVKGKKGLSDQWTGKDPARDWVQQCQSVNRSHEMQQGTCTKLLGDGRAEWGIWGERGGQRLRGRFHIASWERGQKKRAAPSEQARQVSPDRHTWAPHWIKRQPEDQRLHHLSVLTFLCYTSQATKLGGIMTTRVENSIRVQGESNRVMLSAKSINYAWLEWLFWLHRTRHCPVKVINSASGGKKGNGNAPPPSPLHPDDNTS